MKGTEHRFFLPHAICLSICAVLLQLAPAGRAQQTKPADTAKPPYDKVYALCIGINEYATPVAGSDLRWAVNDATELDKVFRNRYGYDSKLLVKEQASRKGITEALDERFIVAGPEDVLIIYFAGHGRTVAVANPGENKDAFDGYLLPQDLKVTTETELKEEPYKTGAINMRLLAERLKDPKQVKAKHVLLILDCCASGMAASSRGAGLRVDPGYVKSLASQRTRQIISAGQGDQKSYEYGDNGPSRHGIFTAKLIDLLQAYPVRTIISIFPKLQEDVFTEIQKLHGDRVIPQRKLLIDEGGDYVFIEKGVKLDWNREVEKSVSDGRSRGYEPTTDAEVKEAQTAAKETETDRTADPAWQKKTTEYEKRAAAGDANAQEAVVYCHQGGLGVPRDDRKAYHWARESNDNGNKQGRALTAYFIKHGAADDVPPESREAISSQLLAGVPKEIVNNLQGIDAMIATSSGKKKKNGITTPRIRESGFIGDVGDFFGGLAPEGKKNFQSRLSIIESELNVPKGTPIKWQRVKEELNGWRGDIAKSAAGATADKRASLDALDKVVNDMQLKTRTLDKTFILGKIKDAKQALDKVESPGAK